MSARAGINNWKMPKRIQDSDDDVPVFGPNAEKLAWKKARLEDSDSDDDMPLFGRNSPSEKIRQQEEEQESQQPLAPEDYLKQEIAGWTQEELNAEAVDEAEARLGIAASIHDEEDVARTAAAKMTRFKGKDTLKISK